MATVFSVPNCTEVKTECRKQETAGQRPRQSVLCFALRGVRFACQGKTTGVSPGCHRFHFGITDWNRGDTSKASSQAFSDVHSWLSNQLRSELAN